jgi:hypothetical protein
MRTVQRQLSRLGTAVRRGLYHILGMVHLALVTDAGLLIVAFAPFVFDTQLMPKTLSLLFFVFYVVCDLIRLRFLGRATISLGFTLIFLTLLDDSPFAALLIAILGSLVSEVLQSRVFSKQHLAWFPTLRRAFFYAGHHAVAGLGALIAYQLTRACFAPWLLNMYNIHVQATLAYLITYSLVSMLLVWPHDLRIRLLLVADEEPFVRVDFLTTLLLLPIPGTVFYLFKETKQVLVVVGILPPLFAMLFLLARSITKIGVERERLALGDEVSQHLGSPANMAEMVERMLTIMADLMDYRWGAVYGLLDGDIRLCGVKPHKGPVIVRDPCMDQEVAPSGGTVTAKNQASWPLLIEHDDGILAKLAEESPPSRFFHDGLTPATLSDPHLPKKTALIVFPITGRSQGGGEKESTQLISLIALARPKQRFTEWDRDKGQILANKASNVLLSVQRLERAMHEVYQKVEDYAEDPEKVRQAVRELVRQQVDVSKILAVISERAFQGNVRAVLRDVVEGRRGDEVALAPDTLIEIYDQVRDETPGMPPVNSDILDLLQTVTSSLSLAFSFRYQFPDVERGPAFKEFYEFLLAAMDANTAARIVALDSQIVSTVDAVRKRSGMAIGASALPPDAIEGVERLRDIVRLLKEYSQTDVLSDQRVSLGKALDLLVERERAVRERLRDPERFVFLQILSGWRAAITNALENVGKGPARLNVSLRSRRALPLDEITVGLVLRNEGLGVASRVLVQLETSPDYEILEGAVDVGILDIGKTIEPEFTLRSDGEGSLRLQFRITYNDPERKGKVDGFADLLYFREPPPCFMEIPNPYTPGLPLKPGSPTFVGREDIFNFIRQNIPALMQKMTLVLLGERRTGKTSILKQLPARLNDPRYVPIFVDGQALGIDPGMESFFLSLATAIADGLEEAGFSAPRLSPMEVAANAKFVFERRFLPMVREQIEERVLLLTVDEFEELGARVRRGRLPEEVFPYLRHLIQHEDQLAFIFAGTHKMEALVGDYWSVLFNIAKYKKVSFLSHDETTRLITEPVQPHGMVYDDLAIDEMLRLTACHPYFTQLLCTILVNRCNDAHCSYVTIQDVRDAVEELLETGRAHLTFLWQTSDQEAMLTLAALPELRDQLDRVSAAAIADRLGEYQIRMRPGQITKTMDQLTARDIVREIPGNPVSYDFTAQLYAHWLRRYKPLSKVVEEVGVEPTAVMAEMSAEPATVTEDVGIESATE